MATINSSNFGTGALGTVLLGQGVGVAPIFGGNASNARVNVTSATQAMAVNTTYTANDTGVAVVFTLPATASLGDIIKVVGGSVGMGWSIAQNALQAINVQGVTTTVGTGGSLASSTVVDCVTLTCTVAGSSTRWTAEPVGNLAYV